jgi:hypothetical protein
MKFLIYFLLPIIVSCTLLTDMAMNAVSGEKGGINTELVVGDKEQVLGSNIEVKAEEVGKVVGTSDNSVQASNAKEVTVTNNTFPVWGIVALVGLASLVGWLAPRPQAWKRLIKGKHNGD